MGSSIRLEGIKQDLQQYNWKVLSTTYKNLDTEMEFECPEGHTVRTSWKILRDNHICPICQQAILTKRINQIAAKPRGKKRVLGLDQATIITGWSIFDDGQLVNFGIFSVDENLPEIERDHSVKEWLITMISNWKPDYVGIEGIQYQNEMGVTTFQTLARLQGILMECCYELGVEFVVCATNTWRAHCGVKGQTRADKKRSMQLLAKNWYGLNVSNDEADAVGIGKYVSETRGTKPVMVDW